MPHSKKFEALGLSEAALVRIDTIKESVTKIKSVLDNQDEVEKANFGKIRWLSPCPSRA
jgi:hypothetical protein